MIKPSLAALLFLATSTLAATGSAAGIQIGPAFPLGDLRTLTSGAVGAQMVLFGLWDPAPGHVLRARLDGTGASGRPQTVATPLGVAVLGGKTTIHADLGTLGLDYLWCARGTREFGPYFGAGLALGFNTLKVVQEGAQTREHTALSPVPGLYGGYQFTPHWSVELALRASRFRKNLGNDQGKVETFSYSMPIISLVAGYTF